MGSQRGFFANDVDTINSECAERLHLILKSNGRGQNADLEKWARWFKQLRKRVDISTIRASLDWYAQHIKDPHTPRIKNAQTFVEKFARLQQAIQRSTGERAAPDDLQISDLAQTISKHLGLFWPTKEKLEELPFIQISLDNYTDYTKRLRVEHAGCEHLSTVLDSKHPGIQSSRDWTTTRLLRYLLDNISSPRDFVEAWTIDTHELAWNWEKWRGHLLKWAFRMDSPRFVRRQRQLIQDYGRPVSDWDMVVGLINYKG